MKKTIWGLSDSAGASNASAAGSGQLKDVDEQLLKIVNNLKTSVKVVGVGGAGNNTISRLSEMGIEGAKTIAMNTDAQDLLYTVSDFKVLLGAELTGGLGAGSDPETGENAAMESLDDITRVLQGSALVFVTCGLGGGTGSGAAAVVAKAAKDLGALTVAIVTLPFQVEGTHRWQNAEKGFAELKKHADSVIVIQNDTLLSLVPHLPVNQAFRVADDLLSNALKGIAELVTKPGLVNLDFADLRTIMADSGAAVMGLGESVGDKMSESRAMEAVEEAMHSPLLDVDVSTSDRALLNIIGGPDMTLHETQAAVEYLASKIRPNAHIIWGSQIDDKLSKGTVRVMLLVTGVKNMSELFIGSPHAVKEKLDSELAFI